jgi:large subunit ribosomal protein L31
MAVNQAISSRRTQSHRNRVRGATCLILISSAALALWAVASSSIPDDSAFVGYPAVTHGSNPASVAMKGGRDWKAGNIPKKSDFKAVAATAAKKKKAGSAGKEEKAEEPTVHQNVPVIFNGKEVTKLNGTLKEYKVDIWSGAHPVWQGKKGKVSLDASAAVKFQEKYGAMADIFGSHGMEQLEKNKQIKAEQEERARQGLKAY